MSCRCLLHFPSSARFFTVTLRLPCRDGNPLLMLTAWQHMASVASIYRRPW